MPLGRFGGVEEAILHLLVRRIVEERVFERLIGRAGVLDFARAQLGVAEAQRALFAGVLRRGQPPLDDPGQLLPGAGGFVGRLQQLPDLRAERRIGAGEQLQAGDGAAALGLDPDDLPERFERARVVLERGGQHLAEPQGQLVALRIGLGELAPLADHLRELVPAAARRREAVQRGQRRAVGRVDLQDLPEAGGGALRVLQHVLFEARQLAQVAQPLTVVRRVADPVKEQPAQLAVLRLAAVDSLQRVGRLGVLGLHVQDGPQLLDRELVLRELLPGHRGDAPAEPELLVGRLFVLLQRREPGEVELQRRAVLARTLGLLGQRIADRHVRRGELERPRRVPERRRAVAQALHRQLAEAHEDREPRRVVLGVLIEHLVKRRQPVPLLVALVEGHQGSRGALVLGIGREHPLVAAERAVRLLELLLVDVGRAEAQLDFDRRVRRAVGGVAEHVDQPLPVAGLGVERLQPFPVLRREEGLPQRAQRAAVLRIDVEDALPRAGGPHRLLHVLAVDHAELLQELDLRLGLVGLDHATLDHLGQRRPVLLALRELLERVDRVAVVRILLEDLFPERDGFRVPVQALAGELRELELVGQPRVRIARELRLLAEDLVEAAPGALLPGQISLSSASAARFSGSSSMTFSRGPVAWL